MARNFVTVFDAWNLNVLAYRFPGLHCNATDYRRDIAGIINGQQLKKRYAIDYRIINGQQAPPQMLWTCIKSRFSGSHCNYQQCQYVTTATAVNVLTIATISGAKTAQLNH
jgi:hypothetical protein